eukprot:TRINITY_DN32365_c0_g1_i1.p1 TRINITY_DN32365_c0_g1~~TRINITY_DN32365_c0_g1_i1.p1  ORF type:complete len:263 (-),score=53.50 TRINITY_DN32365_c0_g1_i1:280-1068(-)
MRTEQVKHSQDWFNAYTRRYLDRAEGTVRDLVRRKISHTMRVLSHVQGILEELQPDEALAQAAEVAAILHDVGRFPQLLGHKSFDDHAGYDHAEQGAIILAGAEVLNPLPEHWRDVIMTVVRYHNRGVVPEGLDAEAQTVLEILRDADKLDAIQGNLKYMNPNSLHGKALKSGLAWHDTEVSPEVVRLTLDRKLIPFKAINWSNDFILFLCCWLYDLHVPYAFRHLDQSGNYERLLAMLPDQGDFVPVKAQLRADLSRLSRP